MKSVFDVLDEVRRRPELFLGLDESKRAEQLQSLEHLLGGYALALRQHGIQEQVIDFPREFGRYLRTTRGWSASCGPTAAICDVAGRGEEAWQLFWSLVDEFRDHVYRKGASGG